MWQRARYWCCDGAITRGSRDTAAIGDLPIRSDYNETDSMMELCTGELSRDTSDGGLEGRILGSHVAARTLKNRTALPVPASATPPHV